MTDKRFAELLDHLYRSGSFAHYWTPDGQDENGNPAKLSYWFRTENILAPPSTWSNLNLYFSVHPSRVRRGVHEKIHIEDVEAVNALYAEFDTSGDESSRLQQKRAVLDRIAGLQPKPSVIVDSGGGYHAYWLLSDPFKIENDEDRARIQDIQYAWVQYAGGDANVKDLARVLRAPGSKNLKPEYGPVFPKVTFEENDFDLQYDLADLEALLQPIIEQAQTATQAQAHTPAQPVDLDDRDLIEKAHRSRRSGARFARLWAGDTGDYGGDHSQADQALCNMLAFWTARDATRMDALFRQSGLYRMKWERIDYREQTINNAVRSAQQVYTPQNGHYIDPDAVLAARSAVGLRGRNGAAQSAVGASSSLSLVQILNQFSPDDEGNALAMQHLYGDVFLHCDAYGWIYYSGTHWQMEGAEDQLKLAIVETMKERQYAAISIQDEKILRASRPNWNNVRNCMQLFQPKVNVRVSDFDADPDLLNCANGVIDLRTGALEAHTSAQRFTYCVPVAYDPQADYVEWVEFLHQVVIDASVASYLQEAAGYSLTGHTNEECLFYVHGPTRAGKGTFTETMLSIMPRPIGVQADFNTFTSERHGDTQNFDLAPLKPCRFVVASESQRYERLNEAKVKQLTGGDHIRCAFKHKDHFEYRPQFKVWLVSNHAVKGDVDDDAFWGRIRVIEFPHSFFGKEDKRLKRKLASPEMLRGVLNWLVEGAIKWYQSKRGLVTPDVVINTTQRRRSELDIIASWIDEYTKQNPSAWTANSAVYSSYKQYVNDNGHGHPLHMARFSEQLAKKGYAIGVRKRVHGKVRIGISGIEII